MLENITFDNPEFLWLEVILFVIILIDYKFKNVKIQVLVSLQLNLSI